MDENYNGGNNNYGENGQNNDSNNYPPYERQPNQPQYNQQQPYEYQSYMPPQESPSKGMGIASLVLGIAAFVCCGAISAIPGLILGIIARRKDPTNGIALAGIIISAVGILYTVVLMVLFLGPWNDYLNELVNEAQNFS